MASQSFQHKITQATDHLKRHDPVLRELIKTHGRCTIQPHNNYYQALVSAIIGQQLSVKAARSIRERVFTAFGDPEKAPEPEAILGKSVEELRSLGLSNAKARYIQDLALHVLDNRLRFEEFGELSSEEIIAELVAVKGIGVWTAHMFMMFSLGRLDVLPVGDLGIKNGIKQSYAFKTVPTPEDITKLALKNNWHPYESVASWYIWRSLDNSPA